MNIVARLLAVFLLTLNISVLAEDVKEKEKENGPWTVNLEEVDIGVFVAQMADIMGQTVVISPKVRGKVTVVSKTPLGKKAIKELFLSVLNVHGFTAVESEGLVKVIPLTSAKGDNIPLDKKGTLTGEVFVTRVIPVQNAPAAELVKILRPMVSKEAHLAAVATVNAIIVADTAYNIKRLEEVVERIEIAEEETLKVVQLEFAWTEDVVEVITQLMLPKDQKANPPFQVVADKRNNRVVFKGEPHYWEEVEGLITKLDRQSDNNTSAKVVYLSHAVATEVAEILNNIVMNKNDPKAKETNSEIKISADESLNAVVVRAAPSVMEEIKDVIKKLDIPRSQVLIEAAIVEISTQEGQAVGVQVASADTSKNGKSTVPLMGTNLGAGNILSLNQIAAMIKTDEGALGPGITLGAGKTTEDGALRYGLLLQALQSSANSNLLSTPSILTLDNQEAEIVVGQNVPFRTGSTATGTDGTANPFTTIKREDIGVTLKVKPRINEGDVVRLEVEQTTESINKEVSIGSSGSADIVTNKRSIKTVITAGNGEIVVLGGLISDDIVISDSKVPLLGDIPFLGALFRSTSKENVKRNLMVFLRPSIVKEESKKQELADSRYALLRQLIKDDGKEKDSEEAPSIDRIFKGENQ